MNNILNETVDIIKSLLGKKINDIYTDNVVLGIFFTGVKLNTGNAGLCFTPIKMIPEAVCCPSSAKLMPSPDKLKNVCVTDLLEDINSKSILKKTIAIATINALSTYCYEQNLLDENIIFDKDAFDYIDVTNFKKAVVVGALVPILKKLSKNNIDYIVLEKDARTLKGNELKHFAEAETYKQHIPEADIIFITGTTLINDTLEDLLKVANPNAKIILAGPTVSLITKPLTDRGVTIIGSDYVKNADEALEILSLGGSGYHLFGRSTSRIVISK